MLGRGAVTRPDLVNQVKSADRGDNVASLSWQQLLALQLAFLHGNAKSDNMLVGRYKQWLGMLTQGYDEAQTLWQAIKKLKTTDAIIEQLTQTI
jgi:tRNA-dihydrouridine synthase C